MIFSNYKKIWSLIIVFTIGILLWIHACNESVGPPRSMRTDYYVSVLDTSGFTEKLTGNIHVQGAQVFANSISYQSVYQGLTDSSGQAQIFDILPDEYNFSITKRLTPEEVFQITGQSMERILNGQVQNIHISESDTIQVYIHPSTLGQLVLSEIYYNGSPSDPIPYYFHDQFTELYNNSNDTLYLDSLIVADVDAGYVDDDYIHSVHAYMIPGTGHDYPLAPGNMIIIAQDATNHSAVNKSSIDLSKADFEYFAPDEGDVNYDAKNMKQIHHKYGIDFLYSVMSDALAILKVEEPYEYGYDDHDCILFPKSAILDAVEYRDNLSETKYKRLDPALDAGMTGGIETYQGLSVQ
ncbi:MAG: DUF4876 domain-containing protein, partial [Candidatus Marinimicrobia bacterium]|nr:DUF4876 domain-containing protein [Candidatus Neomarinimicrobiota bacterium]